ncbi:MAG: hybrid sensor histidine kinase/response regulator [Pseudomonadota bacterium]
MDDTTPRDWSSFRRILWLAPGLILIAAVVQASWTTAVPLAGLAVVLAALLFFRRGKSRAITLHISIALLITFQTGLLYSTTDEANVGIVWFLVVPAFVALLGSRSHILIWTPVTVAAIAYTWSLYADYASMAHPMSFVNLIGATLVISAAALGVVTERERRERVLVETARQAQAEAQDRERAQRESDEARTALTHFLGSLSHELRTPLTSIVLAADMLDDVLVGSDHAVWPQNIRRNADSLRLLLDDVIDLARSDAARAARDPVPFEIPELIEGVRTIVQPVAMARGQRLFAGAMPDVPVRWEGEADRIRQVLVNLLTNGLRHGQGSGVWLLVRYDDGALVFEVGDDGRGIAPEWHREIFQPFFQAPVTGHPDDDWGTGLGLSISSGYVASMESALQLWSAPGQGAVFSFSLALGALGDRRLSSRHTRGSGWPVQVDIESSLEGTREWARAWCEQWRIEVVEGAAPLTLEYDGARQLGSTAELIRDLEHIAGIEPSDTVNTQVIDDAPPFKCVVCDDDRDVLAVLEARLQAAGHEVRAFVASAAMLGYLRSKPVDVVLLDVDLGAESGLDVLKAVGELEGPNAGVPICMLSGRIDQRERCLALGADAYLLKPSSGPELLQTLATLARRGG